MDNNIPQSNNMKLPAPVETELTPMEQQAGAIPAVNAGSAALPPATLMPQAAQPASTDAADVDEIEEHWIQLVETMIRGGVTDPRSLTQRFSELKAQYIRSRYGVEVKQAGNQGGQHDVAP